MAPLLRRLLRAPPLMPGFFTLQALCLRLELARECLSFAAKRRRIRRVQAQEVASVQELWRNPVSEGVEVFDIGERAMLKIRLILHFCGVCEGNLYWWMNFCSVGHHSML